MFIGTQAENIADMVRKKRHSRGAQHFVHRHPERVQGELNGGGGKLTNEAVREMRKAHRAGESGAALGRRFGVSRGVANKIVAGKLWKHVSDEDVTEGRA
jgi:hypothetical protein